MKNQTDFRKTVEKGMDRARLQRRVFSFSFKTRSWSPRFRLKGKFTYTLSDVRDKDIFTCFAWSKNKNLIENGRRIPPQGETVAPKKTCSCDL